LAPCLSPTGRDDAAWDVLQESWRGIGKGLARLKDAGLFKRWAYTIVTRAAATRLRRMPPEQSREPELLEQEPQAENERDEALGHLRGALQQPKREDRVLVSLRYLENFELWELALILGIPEGSIKSRLHRIRHQLKDLLEKMNHE
jgi:RNA polymerase sigma factor (sigma-70 family)